MSEGGETGVNNRMIVAADSSRQRHGWNCAPISMHLLHISCKGCNTCPRANSLDLSIGSSGHKDQHTAGAGG